MKRILRFVVFLADGVAFNACSQAAAYPLGFHFQGSSPEGVAQKPVATVQAVRISRRRLASG